MFIVLFKGVEKEVSGLKEVFIYVFFMRNEELLLKEGEKRDLSV